MKDKRILIGIDCGVNTGIGIVGEEGVSFCGAMKIHEAFNEVMVFADFTKDANKKLHIRVEDARKRKWFGSSSNEKMQGAGSVKRDAKIWEDFLTDLCSEYENVTFEMVHPIKGGTKINANVFKQITGYKGRTNVHGRDAVMLVWNLR